MKSFARSALAAVAAGMALAGCATYDYGPGYAYPQPYNGYNYGYKARLADALSGSCALQSMPITDSGACRSPIPLDVGGVNEARC